MKFCQRHWDMMRAAVEARGMTPLVSRGGAAAAAQIVDELRRGQTTDNFDPLMAMHWNIAANLLEKLGQAGRYLLFEGPEDPIEVSRLSDPALQAKYAGRTWPRCPVCYANIAHEFSCTHAACSLARVDGYDACIDWSADGMKARFDELMRAK